MCFRRLVLVFIVVSSSMTVGLCQPHPLHRVPRFSLEHPTITESSGAKEGSLGRELKGDKVPLLPF